MKLTIPEFHVGREKAEKYVALLCKELNWPVPKGQEFGGIITVNNDQKETKIHLAKEVESVRKTGKADLLQMIFDSSDRFLNTPLSLGLTGDIPGLKVKIESNYGSHSSIVHFPGFIEPPETSFSQDIVFYRKQAVKSFNKEDLPGFARAYRGYLQSCVSLVECFIHRYTFHIKGMIPSMQEFDTAILDSRSSIDDRLDAWMTTFAIHKMKDFKNSKSRSKFLELKNQRNAIVHPSYPSVPYGVKDVVKFLNYCQDGVGGLLGDLRRYAGYSENIGFIKQIRSQGEVRIA